MKSDPKETQPFGSKHVLGRLACGSASILLSFGYVRPLGVLWLGFEGFWLRIIFSTNFEIFFDAVSLFIEFRDPTYIFLHFDKTNLSESSQNCNSSNTLLTEVPETPKNLFEMHRSSEIHRFKVAKISRQIWFLAWEILVRSTQQWATLIARYSAITNPFLMVRHAFWRGTSILPIGAVLCGFRLDNFWEIGS